MFSIAKKGKSMYNILTLTGREAQTEREIHRKLFTAGAGKAPPDAQTACFSSGNPQGNPAFMGKGHKNASFGIFAEAF